MSEPLPIFRRLLTTDGKGRKVKTQLLKEIVKRVKQKPISKRLKLGMYFKYMLNWYRKYKAKQAHKELCMRALANCRDWKRGYDWAAGELLRNTKSFSEIDAYTYNSCEPFDFGADAACTKLKDLYKQIHFE